MRLDARFSNSDICLGYDPSRHGIGIVHFGTGAFHRAHQAVYTDKILRQAGGDWRILGVSLQSTKGADALNGQDGIYSLVQRAPDGKVKIDLIGSIAGVEAASRGTETVFATLASPQTHIVSMTVTEKAYGINREHGQVDPNHPSIKADLVTPENPSGLIGILVKGLKLRKEQGIAPFTVLCCDNLPENGALVRAGVIDFAKRIDPELCVWIADNVCFPSTMVDRITPAVTPELVDEVETILGVRDEMPVETEPFTQWVIEDNFSGPRPTWEDAGVLFVKDVAPYEKMKLRMLNGTHSLIAYLGFVHGCTYVRDAMAHSDISLLVKAHIGVAAKTLAPLDGIDFDDYGAQLTARFANPHIAHETYQIAMDGSQKMPQRVFEPAVDALNSGQPLDSFALAAASWMRYCLGQKPDGTSYPLRDPREQEIAGLVAGTDGGAQSVFEALSQMPNLMPAELQDSALWCEKTIDYLQMLIAGELDKIAMQFLKAD